MESLKTQINNPNKYKTQISDEEKKIYIYPYVKGSARSN